MRQATLREKYVTLPPRSSSRLRVEDGARPRFTMLADEPTSRPAMPDVAPGSEPRPATRPAPLAWLRAIGSGIAWTLRAIGAVLGIAAAAISVGVLVAIQRLLHLD